ncbi:MAG TPA: tRNA (adenosine(37)-N6)-threonylcarbamoyltransferase complex ATPase subunit type 1 TsaE [Candidatus Omnitrophica bacterium]|nr:tRNA (adenosine(37)-N6)-threonylcarbamoyltransferase complex ATPase subunit type 1 TsaE [Candidatus Omnitrophota bacterium]
MAFLKYISESEGQTRRLAAKLARGLKENDCLALVGDFGSGKTTFVKGLAKGLACGKKDYVCSPSFVILKIYRGRVPVYHFDLYRLKRERDAEAVGLFEFIGAGGVAVIEWPEKVLKYLPDSRLEIRFFVRGEKKRELHFFVSDGRLKKLLEKVAK